LPDARRDVKNLLLRCHPPILWRTVFDAHPLVGKFLSVERKTPWERTSLPYLEK
jgi:hypothetical protein